MINLKEYSDPIKMNAALNDYILNEIIVSEIPRFLNYLTPFINTYQIDATNLKEIKHLSNALKAKEFCEKGVIDSIASELDGYVSKEDIRRSLKNIFLIENDAEFLKSHDGKKVPNGRHTATAYTLDGICHLRMSTMYDEQSYKHAAIHESFHKISGRKERPVDSRLNTLVSYLMLEKHPTRKYYGLSGVKVTILDKNGDTLKSYYNGLNEAITEFLTKRVMGDKFEAYAYTEALAALEKLIELDIVDINTIKKAYLTNDISLLKDKFDKAFGGSAFLFGAFDSMIKKVRNQGDIDRINQFNKNIRIYSEMKKTESMNSKKSA